MKDLKKGDVIPLWGLVGVSRIVARKRVGKEGADSESARGSISPGVSAGFFLDIPRSG